MFISLIGYIGVEGYTTPLISNVEWEEVGVKRLEWSIVVVRSEALKFQVGIVDCGMCNGGYKVFDLRGILQRDPFGGLSRRHRRGQPWLGPLPYHVRSKLDDESSREIVKGINGVVTPVMEMEAINVAELISHLDQHQPRRGSFTKLPHPLFQSLNSHAKPHIRDILISQTPQLPACALILNTFEDLEASVLSQIRVRYPQTLSSRCMTWLDSQPLKSVMIYVSFGSVATMTRERLVEIWYGLVSSKKLFLCVVRPDIAGPAGDPDPEPAELEMETKERGFIVGWAPQEEVLGHKAIGGFLTHSGCNSSLAAGVPMICLPTNNITAASVSQVCKIGLEMKDLACDRNLVEKMVNDLIDPRREEFLNSAQGHSEPSCFFLLQFPCLHALHKINQSKSYLILATS
ncbi:hypothetical protein VNO78_08897 [Psophocarpus tetragonolobus]|uniref:Glycosyltransferase n=1 Tax=Psophocarpus tetragonolobus TaxID=3891 RepID=A0AAN9T647_PSOTE